MFKYLVSGSKPPEKIEIISETAHFVTYTPVGVDWNGNKRVYDKRTGRKITSHDSWHDTYEEAKQFIVDAKQKVVRNLEGQLIEAKEQLVKAQNLKEDAI